MLYFGGDKDADASRQEGRGVGRKAAAWLPLSKTAVILRISNCFEKKQGCFVWM
jgi:hypothetical protein